MNETFAKVLQYAFIFWIVLGLFATVFASRVNTYFITGSAGEIIETRSFDTISLLFNIATFQVNYAVPIWISVLLDVLIFLTFVALIMAFTNR